MIEIPLARPELFAHFGESYLGDVHGATYPPCDNIGLKPPRGILLHGPPGTGKTHLARAIAASTKSSVIIINGPELSSAYHGETEARLREVFRNARAKSPCIVVLDEIDALVPRREDGAGGEVEKRVVATLLTIMDGMEDNGTIERVVVIGTTNRPNAIDPALRRPGRFDREFEIGEPNQIFSTVWLMKLESMDLILRYRRCTGCRSTLSNLGGPTRQNPSCYLFGRLACPCRSSTWVCRSRLERSRSRSWYTRNQTMGERKCLIGLKRNRCLSFSESYDCRPLRCPAGRPPVRHALRLSGHTTRKIR